MIAPQQKYRQQRVGGVARFSGMTMMVLGGLSAALTLLNPLSAEVRRFRVHFRAGLGGVVAGRALAGRSGRGCAEDGLEPDRRRCGGDPLLGLAYLGDHRSGGMGRAGTSPDQQPSWMYWIPWSGPS